MDYTDEGRMSSLDYDYSELLTYMTYYTRRRRLQRLMALGKTNNQLSKEGTQ